MRNNQIKCDICGKFISHSELNKGGGASSCFIPDTEFTNEEHIFRCKSHTTTAGPPRKCN